MPNTVFFVDPGTLSHQQLQLGIAAFEAGVQAKNTDETESRKHFLEAKQQLTNSITDKTTGSLAHCYLTLIEFYENNETASPDIIPKLVLASQYINSIDSEGLKPMSPDFKILLLEMIEAIDNGAFLQKQLVEKAREYRQSLQPRGEADWIKVNAHFDEGKQKIATIQTARALLEKDENEAALHPVQQRAM